MEGLAHAERCEHRGHVIEAARRDATGEHEHVVPFERGGERGRDGVLAIGELLVGRGGKARERERRRKAVRVRAPDLVIEDRLSRLDELVAGGEDRNARCARNLEFGAARGRRDREFRGREPRAGVQQEVARPRVGALSMHVTPGLRFAALVQFGMAVGRADLLDGHDRVAAARHHRAGHDLEAVGPGSEGEHGGAGGLDAGDAEPAAALGSAGECDAIHRHAIERGRVALGVQRRAEYAAGAVSERDDSCDTGAMAAAIAASASAGVSMPPPGVSSACRGP